MLLHGLLVVVICVVFVRACSIVFWCEIYCMMLHGVLYVACSVFVSHFYHVKYVFVSVGDSLCDVVGHALCDCV